MLNRRHLLFTAACGVVLASCGAKGAEARLPAPKFDPPSPNARETVVLAGGCFWGVQGVFARVKGVISAVSGYCGGAADTAEYETVGTGRTGHAESVEVVFDPRQVSFGKILQIFFTVATDPTELNRQGPDEGPQYRNEIFCGNAGQQQTARAYIAQLDEAKAYPRKIVTLVSGNKPFYRAEEYHQDYLILHPEQPYIAINDLPKVRALKALFPDMYRDKALRAGRA